VKLYEVQVRPRGHHWEYTYHRNTSKAKQAFNAANKLYRDKSVPVQIVANRIELKTSLSADEWLLLLAGDAPGEECALTPQDLILSREIIKETVHT